MKTKTKTKIWLGVGAFAVASAAGVSPSGGLPNFTVGQQAQAADGTCGWERNENGRWSFDQYCGRGERFTGDRYYYQNQRNERWNGHDNGWHRGWERGERRRYNEQGERGERWGG